MKLFERAKNRIRFSTPILRREDLALVVGENKFPPAAQCDCLRTRTLQRLLLVVNLTRLFVRNAQANPECVTPQLADLGRVIIAGTSPRKALLSPVSYLSFNSRETVWLKAKWSRALVAGRRCS